MAAVQQLVTAPGPTPISTMSPNGLASSSNGAGPAIDVHTAASGAMQQQRQPASRPQCGDARIVAIVYNQGKDKIVSVFASVLGRPFILKRSFGEIDEMDQGHVISPHKSLMEKPRTYFISTTFPDVRAALPNLDILTVGADAVEIRVDLLKEPLSEGKFASIPSLDYVGRQVMLLRQTTELPIIFTTRLGVEYIDVELWLPEAIRRRLWELKGNSRIMSAFHDFSGTFKWPSPHAQAIFLESCRYADIVKMIAIINDHNENFELEYFRSKMRTDFPDSPPLSAVNMGETGQFSRTLNKVFCPITHPLLPIIAAPGQMSAAEINAALSLLGQLPKKSMYGIHSSASTRIATPQAPFTRTYCGHPAVVLASSSDDAASALYALKALKVPEEQKVFLDLADGATKTTAAAAGLGFVAYGAEDVVAFTTVQTIRGLVGQNVPYSFVRLAGGRGLY
ncbi:unnamed protein product [Parascedosporium putredinis]|uniref:3-dehydroquinate dehydratase n=1 Tax=Parascedosporium putredinis TaxID=1442378 RepID=A0A9P1GXP8_9PEZI|nr:unnamed protein product [Parascedosporium putredinis]CAI7990043.1 unnamed protein product [Parascedosporium putredinis]